MAAMMLYIALAGGAAAIAFSWVEATGMRKYWRWTYALGVKLSTVREHWQAGARAPVPGREFETPAAQARWVDGQTCLFLRKSKTSVGGHLVAMYLLRGRIDLGLDGVVATARLPLGTVLFWGFCVLGLFSLGGFRSDQSPFAASTLFMPAGVLGGALIVLILFLWYEKRQWRRALAEIRAEYERG